ncbi:hypothetical protein MmiAt1_07170 [Methanimicrococcus sp. At1]|uniref:Uncharacterized protein n=1 Tax=Methanimicrococcus hacksteinii TaxID=3028293 RepID=A0ABU3VPC3_9EURY|nr:hypothetical protein [Methanimicrococcus sp. At1]MDV0445160.1 hypothetical protein [Methanimicrococcus sp. At1]
MNLEELRQCIDSSKVYHKFIFVLPRFEMLTKKTCSQRLSTQIFEDDDEILNTIPAPVFGGCLEESIAINSARLQFIYI